MVTGFYVPHMVSVKNSRELVGRLGSTFGWLDFARVAWPDHPAFKKVASREQRARDMHRLQSKTSTWLGRLVRRGVVRRVARNPVMYRARG